MVWPLMVMQMHYLGNMTSRALILTIAMQLCFDVNMLILKHRGMQACKQSWWILRRAGAEEHRVSRSCDKSQPRRRLPFLFVITQAIQNTNITAQTIAALSHHGPVAETLLVNRVVYPAAFIDGRTPQEVDKNGQAAREVGKLWVNIKTCLHATMQEQRKAANG